jgi:hypothetical protein
MVKGIETNHKVHKHKQQNDITYLSKDLNEIRKTAEHYINTQRPEDPEKLDALLTHRLKKYMPFARMISILLSIMGIFVLLHGIISLTQVNLTLGAIVTIIGFVFILSFILFELF